MKTKKKLPPIDLEELAERGIVTDLDAKRAQELLGSVPLILIRHAIKKAKPAHVRKAVRSAKNRQ